MSEHPLFVASPDPVNPALEGIIIDTFDRASAQKKWMGRSESEITQRDRMNLRPVVREQVRTILKRFPPSISKR